MIFANDIILKNKAKIGIDDSDSSISYYPSPNNIVLANDSSKNIISSNNTFIKNITIPINQSISSEATSKYYVDNTISSAISNNLNFQELYYKTPIDDYGYKTLLLDNYPIEIFWGDNDRQCYFDLDGSSTSISYLNIGKWKSSLGVNSTKNGILWNAPDKEDGSENRGFLGAFHYSDNDVKFVVEGEKAFITDKPSTSTYENNEFLPKSKILDLISSNSSGTSILSGQLALKGELIINSETNDCSANTRPEELKSGISRVGDIYVIKEGELTVDDVVYKKNDWVITKEVVESWFPIPPDNTQYYYHIKNTPSSISEEVENRLSTLESELSGINTLVDSINGETI